MPETPTQPTDTTANPAPAAAQATTDPFRVPEAPPTISEPSADAGAITEEEYDRLEAAQFAKMLASNGAQGTTPEATAGEQPSPTAAEPGAKPEATAGEQPAPTAAEPGEPTPPAPAADEKSEVELLRKAMREKDGRWGSEKQQYEKQLAEIRQDLDAARAALREREAAEAAAAQEALAARKDSQFTDDDIKAAFTPEQIEANGIEYYREQMQGADWIVRRRMEQLRAEMAVERRGETVFDAIERRVPGYRELNTNAESNGFGRYLNEIVPETGLSRRDHAQDAIRRYSISEDPETRTRALDALARIVGGFATNKGTGETPSPQPPPAKKPAAAAIDPKDYVAPSVTAGQAPKPPAPKKYSAQQIAAYLAKAASQGEAAYDRAAAWVAEQQRLGLAP